MGVRGAIDKTYSERYGCVPKDVIHKIRRLDGFSPWRGVGVSGRSLPTSNVRYWVKGYFGDKVLKDSYRELLCCAC